jgi:peptidoglycan/xylan/chitin deacetylase (PgdA/CDA1 family)
MSTPTVPTLMYHHVSPLDGGHCVHPDRLREQLAWLREEQIQILTGTEFRRFCTGEWRPAGPAVVLTFDDGWLDNWVYALPILREFAAPAIFFVVTSWPGAGQPRLDLNPANWPAFGHAECMKRSANENQRDDVVMRWSELRAAQDTGLIELQSHSHSHGGWWAGTGASRGSLDSVATDLLRSRDTLQSELGAVADQLCWPRGEFTGAMQKAARELGFQVQHSTLRGANEWGTSPSRVVRRLHVENRPLDWFVSRVELYSRSWPAAALGWCHQELQRVRMRRRHPAVWNQHGGLGAHWWRLV